MIIEPGKRGLIAIAWGLATGLAGGANALPTCEGTYAAEALRPLPAAIVVDLDIRDNSPDHLRRAKRFLAGIREAGVAVGPKPNVLLSISSSRLAVSPEQSGGGRVDQNSSAFSGLEGVGDQSLPVIPADRLGATTSPPAPPVMIIRVEAKEAQAATSSWVANVRCQTIGTDDGALAQDLGRLIGGALGKRIERGPL
jgi:hypothetical protein